MKLYCWHLWELTWVGAVGSTWECKRCSSNYAGKKNPDQSTCPTVIGVTEDELTHPAALLSGDPT